MGTFQLSNELGGFSLTAGGEFSPSPPPDYTNAVALAGDGEPDVEGTSGTAGFIEVSGDART